MSSNSQRQTVKKRDEVTPHLASFNVYTAGKDRLNFGRDCTQIAFLCPPKDDGKLRQRRSTGGYFSIPTTTAKRV
jgi:hypothetical protein